VENIQNIENRILSLCSYDDHNEIIELTKTAQALRKQILKTLNF